MPFCESYRAGNPKRIPPILHHALTGKVGYAKAVGFERGGFGRNSKVLQGYMRSMINIAPEKSDSNETLIVASGKSNNSAEFQPFGVRLHPQTMTYRRDDSIDIEAWKERVGADFGSSGPRATIAHVVKIVGRAGLSGIPKKKLITALKNETGVSPATAYRLVDKAETQKAVIRRKNDEFYGRLVARRVLRAARGRVREADQARGRLGRQPMRKLTFSVAKLRARQQQQ